MGLVEGEGDNFYFYPPSPKTVARATKYAADKDAVLWDTPGFPGGSSSLFALWFKQGSRDWEADGWPWWTRSPADGEVTQLAVWLDGSISDGSSTIVCSEPPYGYTMGVRPAMWVRLP